MRSVRPFGDPCRPMKLRLEELAHTWRPVSLSGFIARHMEQPASRHWNPAARNTSSSPSDFAYRATLFDPGTASAVTRGDTFFPLITRAASRRSLIRPFVQEPTNATSTCSPLSGLPSTNPVCS